MLNKLITPALIISLLTGCAEYHAPGGPADFRALPRALRGRRCLAAERDRLL